MNNTFLLFYSPKPWSQVLYKGEIYAKKANYHKQPSKCDHFGCHGT